MPSLALIDGRSGSGKTRYAEALADAIERVTGERPQLLGMDDLYPGWSGLAAGSASLASVLRSVVYRRYDWGLGAFAETVKLDPSRPLIVEGCGSITAESVAAAREWGGVRTVWIECPEALRRERALSRDGDAFAPHWEEWAAQERELFARAQPIARAREIVHAV